MNGRKKKEKKLLRNWTFSKRGHAPGWGWLWIAVLHAAFFPAQKATTAKRGLPLDFVNFGSLNWSATLSVSSHFTASRHKVWGSTQHTPAHSSPPQPPRLLSNV